MLDALDFEAVETRLRQVALEVAGQALQCQLNANHTDHDGPLHRCRCGHQARYAGRRDKTFTTVLGTLTLERAYYHCTGCGHGVFPRDRALGLADTSLSPGATRMAGFAAAEVSFATASELLSVLSAVRIDTKQVERSAEALGAEIAEDERARIEPEDAPASTMYLGLDGTGVPVRRTECEGRAGKQPDGTSKTREVKLATVWTAEQRDAQGRPVRDPGSTSYSAAVESAASRDTDRHRSAFAQRVEREARRRGFEHAQRQVILGDGAHWIWGIAEELFPHAVQIVDLFHAKERVWEAAHAIYGTGTDLAIEWARQQCETLEADRLDDVIDALGVHRDCEPAVQCMGYLSHNRHRMRYATFRSQGLCVSSGLVESGCKRVVCTRLKRGGMHWTVAGANAIIALRCNLLSGRFEDFWEHRALAA